jgi:glycosyltransferase involved in cell wall biosynthesis
MHVVFWQSSLSIHQCAPIRSLAAGRVDRVTLVAQQNLRADRSAQGWVVPEFPGVRVVVAPDASTITTLLSEDPGEAYHVFSGVHAYPMVEKAFYACLRTGAPMGLLVEPVDGSGWKGSARWLRGRWDSRRFGRRVSFILATGRMGVDWYRGCGYPLSVIYPYGYFVEPPPLESGVARDVGEAGPVQLLYLGQSIRRKGGDLLLRALQALPDLDWQLTLMGDGPMNQEWRKLSRRLGLEERVDFLPPAPNGQAMERLSASDLLVLPSRFDGWGAVVNEALMRGVPVVASDRCGAADLLAEPWRGDAFRAGSVEDLRRVLRRRIVAGPRTTELTERIRRWSRCIEGEAAANYLVAVLKSAAGKGPRPTAPWLRPEAALDDDVPWDGLRTQSRKLAGAAARR